MEESSSTSGLTSTTAPGKVFASRSALADHYKSDWHRYNLKRRSAGLPVLLELDFQARLEAAQQLRQEKVAGTSHLKNKKKDSSKTLRKGAKNRGVESSDGGATRVSQAAAYEKIKNNSDPASESKASVEVEESEKEINTSPDAADTDNAAGENAAVGVVEPTAEQIALETAIEIDPRQCLFDRHVSATVDANISRMQRKYGFFVPDQEFLVDAEGLIGYCHEKIKLGHVCLYCQRIFSSWQGCQEHMLATRHCKLRYEQGIDLDEFDVFYDFDEADADFLGAHRRKATRTVVEEDNGIEDNNAEDGDGWEDISDDEAGDDDMEADGGDGDDDESMYDGYEEEIQSMGFDVTPLGELVFPDGRIIGHRSLRRYYKQRSTSTGASTAVVAARHGAGERLYRGKVYNLSGMGGGNPTDQQSLALRQAGIAPALAAGRAGKGILVANGSGGGSFSQVSIYRYRAAIRKQRRGHDIGHRAWAKTNRNINRMDKKHNRLMNGVSVAHAAR